MIDFGLLVPIAAIVAFFGMLGLGFRSFLLGRTVRRLEEQLAQGGGSAADASLERVRQLQARAAVSSGTRPTARGVLIGLLAVFVALAGVGGWLVFRDSGGGTAGNPPAQGNQNADAGNANGDANGAAGENGGDDPALPDAEPPDETAEDEDAITPSNSTIPEEPPPIGDKAQYTIQIFNASGIQGAAGDITQPRIQFAGYTVGDIGNSPDGRQDLARSVVMAPDNKRDVAVNVAKDLGVGVVSGLDGGFTEEELGSADAIVVVGQDIASG